MSLLNRQGHTLAARNASSQDRFGARNGYGQSIASATIVSLGPWGKSGMHCVWGKSMGICWL